MHASKSMSRDAEQSAALTMQLVFEVDAHLEEGDPGTALAVANSNLAPVKIVTPRALKGWRNFSTRTPPDSMESQSVPHPPGRSDCPTSSATA